MKEYKPIIISIIKFFSVYLVITGLYYLYLNYYQQQLQTCDPFTRLVANQASALLRGLGFDSNAFHFDKKDYMHIAVNNQWISIVNEGCNALSVIILYVSFIIAFSVQWKKTLLYLVVTLILLHITNIIRVAFINYIVYSYPEYAKEVHDYIFPAIIYGLVIILWIGWIKYFVFKNK